MPVVLWGIVCKCLFFPALWSVKDFWGSGRPGLASWFYLSLISSVTLNLQINGLSRSSSIKMRVNVKISYLAL